MEEFKAGEKNNEAEVGEKSTSPEENFVKAQEQKKVEKREEAKQERRKGTIYAEPLRAEGNERFKKVINEKMEQQKKLANETEEGVRIKFSDTNNGREIYTFITEGYAGQKREKSIDVLVYDHVSVHKYPKDLAENMVAFFGDRAKITK